jgi:hypothetical protein
MLACAGPRSRGGSWRRRRSTICRRWRRMVTCKMRRRRKGGRSEGWTISGYGLRELHSFSLFFFWLWFWHRENSAYDTAEHSSCDTHSQSRRHPPRQRQRAWGPGRRPYHRPRANSGHSGCRKYRFTSTLCWWPGETRGGRRCWRRSWGGGWMRLWVRRGASCDVTMPSCWRDVETEVHMKL